jgi:hypothetical protein
MGLATFIPVDPAQVTIRPRIYKVDIGKVGFQGPTGPTGASSDRFISVKDAPYNAAGNGVADDTSAIDAAKVAAGTDGTLIFPKGTYLVTGLEADVAGQNWLMWGATLKLKDSSAQVPVVLTTADDFTLSGAGTIDGNRAGQTSITAGATTRHGIRAESVDDFTVVGMKILRTVAAAVWLDNVTDSLVADNKIADCGIADSNHKMIQVWFALGDSEGVTIRGNRIDCQNQNNGGIGVTAVGNGRTLSRILVGNNDIRVGNAGATATLGIEAFCDNTSAAIKDSSIFGNIINGVLDATTDQVYGISVGGPSNVSLQGDTNFAVWGNTIRDCTAFSIEVIGSGVAVSGNTIYNSGEMLVAADEVTGGIRGVSITGNTFIDCGVSLLAAIALVGAANGIFGIVVSENSLYDCKAQGIRQTGIVRGANIRGNTFQGINNTGISLAGTFTESIISGNTLDMTGAAADSDGILLANAAITKLIIEGNIIKDASRNGIYGIAVASRVDIRNNLIFDCTVHGIFAAAVMDRWTLTGNRIYDNDRGIIFFPAGTNINVYGNDVYSNPGGDYFLTGSTLIPFNIAGQDVSSGATDSGGSGFELLRTPNG